ncbi:hypothetical protein OESDEN_06502 [Oesophagostomum dentatum]|uniref:Uncharacterized protein n=1 Tax=Oesophagostomum dentatum TaxID=61180 RepID=A0A0B1TBU3_OESDE|nr:hypothetical protein OESDEN_06502 [Oesophagostomum dentatum]
MDQKPIGPSKDALGNNGIVLDEQAFAKVKDIHRNWYFFSIKALLGQLGKDMLRKLDSDELPKKWSFTYKSIKAFSKVLDNNEQLPGARVYNKRIYDLVIDNKGNNIDGEMHIPPFLKDAFGVINSFSGAKNARILSPRLFPVMPDKAPTKGFLSPSLFPLYKDDAEQQIMPVPKMLEEVGLNERDRERILEMVMEVSGARDATDKAIKICCF